MKTPNHYSVSGKAPSDNQPHIQCILLSEVEAHEIAIRMKEKNPSWVVTVAIYDYIEVNEFNKVG